MRLLAALFALSTLVGCAAFTDVLGEVQRHNARVRVALDRAAEASDTVDSAAKSLEALGRAQSGDWTGALGAIGGALVAGGGGAFAVRSTRRRQPDA